MHKSKSKLVSMSILKSKSMLKLKIWKKINEQPSGKRDIRVRSPLVDQIFHFFCPIISYKLAFIIVQEKVFSCIVQEYYFSGQQQKQHVKVEVKVLYFKIERGQKWNSHPQKCKFWHITWHFGASTYVNSRVLRDLLWNCYYGHKILQFPPLQFDFEIFKVGEHAFYNPQ
jgi:hypothetical protein